MHIFWSSIICTCARVLKTSKCWRQGRQCDVVKRKIDEIKCVNYAEVSVLKRINRAISGSIGCIYRNSTKTWRYKKADSILYYDSSFPRMKSRIIISIIDHCQHASLKLTSSFIIRCSEAHKKVVTSFSHVIEKPRNLKHFDLFHLIDE